MNAWGELRTEEERPEVWPRKVTTGTEVSSGEAMIAVQVIKNGEVERSGNIAGGKQDQKMTERKK